MIHFQYDQKSSTNKNKYFIIYYRVKMWANDNFTVHGNLIKNRPINITREAPTLHTEEGIHTKKDVSF